MKPLSFIIITYNRPHDMLELLQNIVQLQSADKLLEEVIVVNNASTSDYSAVKNYAAANSAINIKYYDAHENLGVARGRNYAISLSKASILIMLDDDAVLQNGDCLEALVAAFQTANTKRPKAIVSFKVLYYDTLQLQRTTLPHKDFEAYKNKPHFETYYYAGGAHAIRKEVLEAVGNYPEDFFYGMEEYDLSYRILDKGYSIVYSDKITMLHKESPLGRKPKSDKLRMMWVNKSKVAWRYLPRMYFYSTAFMWSLEYLLKTRFQLRGFFMGWRQIFQISRTEKRTPVSAGTIAYIRSLRARLWY